MTTAIAATSRVANPVPARRIWHVRRRLPIALLAGFLGIIAACGTDQNPAAADATGADDDAPDDAPDGAMSDANQADAAQDDGAAATTDAADPLFVPAAGYRAVFIDIGQGDATLLIASGGETMLVDSGRKPDLIVQRLVALGVERVDAVMASHADADHIAGLVKVMQRWPVKTVYWNGLKKETAVFKDFFEAASKVKLIAAKRGDVYQLGSLDLELLHPAHAIANGDHNSSSLVVLTGCAGAWLLLPGDANAESEASMLQAGVLSDIDVLHLAHHGSKNSTTQAFLDVIKPEHAIISAGLTNAYNHPDPEVIARLKAAKIKIHRVDTTWGDDSVTLWSACKGSYTIEPAHAK